MFHVRLSYVSCVAIVAALTPKLFAHHSTVVYDFNSEEIFVGTVLSVEFQNPHIALTLDAAGPDGNREVVEFIEGPSANMLLRQGLEISDLALGSRITATGSPLIDDSRKYYLRRIRLKDGKEF